MQSLVENAEEMEVLMIFLEVVIVTTYQSKWIALGCKITGLQVDGYYANTQSLN